MKKQFFPLFLLIAAIIGITFPLAAQTHKIDSLLSVLKTEHDDTNKVITLGILAHELYRINPDSTIILAEQEGVLSEKLGYLKGKTNSLNNAGIACWVKGDYIKAIDYYMRALRVAEKSGDKPTRGKILGNIGLVYEYQGDYPKSLEYYLGALKISEELENKSGQASYLSNIGNVYIYQNDYQKALDYYQKALAIDEELGDISGQASDFGNMGNGYLGQGNDQKALDYYLKSLKMHEQSGDKRGQQTALGNIGVLYFKLGNYSKAQDYGMKALHMTEETGDKAGLAINLSQLGQIYIRIGKFKEAEEFLKKAIAIDSSIGDLDYLRKAEEDMSELYDTTGRYKPALIYFKRAIVLKDTLFNIDKNKALTRKELTYQFEKKEAAEKAGQDKKDAIAEQDRKKQVIIRNSFVGGFILMLALAFFIFNGYREKQKANLVISTQKSIVEQKQKEILDSIHYAQRIQNALLASSTLLSKNLQEYFVLYKPKDIVSGDFYWATEKDGTFYLAVCDSTGHGVPGAFMSLLNISFLNEAITEKGITKPNEVLNHTRKRLIENISQEGAQDGMDGVLMAISRQSLAITYAAAYNESLIIRNNKALELGADKMPVGASPMEKISFTNQTVKLQSGDTLYLFTDGYADQFGGPKGKKFKFKQLHEMLVAINAYPMAEQKQKLEAAFNNWKGELEQVDDVLLIGIKI